MRRWMAPAALMLSVMARPAYAETAPAAVPLAGAVADGAIAAPVVHGVPADWGAACCAENRRPFESDRAFPGFIGPISNPVLSKDPRALTEARLLYIHNVIPADHPLGGGSFDVYAMQVRVALTERLSLIADKDGITSLNARNIPHETGLLNINVGLKYALVRDVESQFILSAGFTYEPPTGEANVFQNHGDGVMTVFTTAGKEFGDGFHALATVGFQFGLDGDKNSDFFYSSLHLDKQLFGWLYPLVELNWFGYTGGGNRGLPPALGEGDGLLNLGTTGVAGNHLVTLAVGAKAQLGEHVNFGVAWEFPISNRQDLIDNRLLVELILRW